MLSLSGVTFAFVFVLFRLSLCSFIEATALRSQSFFDTVYMRRDSNT